MKWIDESEVDLRQFSGEELCEKLVLEMYESDQEKWFECESFIQNALFILDFDTVSNMEGFSTPFDGYFSSDYYEKIINAFRAIGDKHDADILSEALRLDAYYTKRIESISDDAGSEAVHDEFCDKIDELEKGFYLNTDFDMWSLLYGYLEENIR